MQTNKMTYVHCAVVFVLAFFFRFLPPIGQVTPYGMGILGTFIAAIYGWSTIGMVWPSFICLTAIGLTIGPNQMIAAGFNATILAMIFVFLLMALLEETGATTWLVNTILGSKFTMGKPWLTLFLLFGAAYIGGILNSMVMAIVFIGVFTTLCKNLNVTPYTKLPTCLMIGTALALLMGQISIPVMGNAMMIMATYNAMFPVPLNLLQYMAFMIPMGFLMMATFVCIMRFVLRVDVAPLKNFDPAMFGGTQKASRDMKLAMMFFVIYMVLVVMSSIGALGTVAAFLGKFGMFGIIAMVICVMMLLKKEDGTPYLNFHMSAAKIGWDPVLMVAFIMVISSYMNTAETGISQTLMSLLMPFTTLSPFVFIVVALFFAMVTTNVATNLIIIVMVMPVIYNFAGMVGLNASGLMCLLFIAAHLALATPAAAPPTGIMMTAKEMVKVGDFSKYALISLPILFAVLMLVGIPYSNIIF
jgi:sodium-dependent dicarboxylate transporter 2/3/5